MWGEKPTCTNRYLLFIQHIDFRTPALDQKFNSLTNSLTAVMMITQMLHITSMLPLHICVMVSSWKGNLQESCSRAELSNVLKSHSFFYVLWRFHPLSSAWRRSRGLLNSGGWRVGCCGGGLFVKATSWENIWCVKGCLCRGKDREARSKIFKYRVFIQSSDIFPNRRGRY